jgi:hypothetical protein
MLSGSNARLILKGPRCGPSFPRAFHSRCERTLPPVRMAASEQRRAICTAISPRAHPPNAMKAASRYCGLPSL